MSGDPARVLGVLGTMVWDTIWREGPDDPPTEGWGGISYALAAADATAPPGFVVRPLVKMGRDLSDRGLEFLRGLAVPESLDAISITECPNTRVELRYRSDETRRERISGDLPTWSWPEIEARLPGLDVLYLNFITGREVDLDTAQLIRERFSGLIYADIHSLMLAIGPGGERTPQRLDRPADWLACFDIVQLNEDELQTLSGRSTDPWSFAVEMVEGGVRAVIVTLGGRGAAYAMAIGASSWGERRSGRPSGAPPAVVTGRVSSESARAGDPTGCGDVFGVTALFQLLNGCKIEAALQTANAAASSNVAYRGVRGLNTHLKGELGRA